MTEKTYIYGLLCPLENKIRYVGKSVNPVERYRAHLTLQDAHANPTSPLNAKHKWILELLARGLEPQLVILEELDCDGLNHRVHGPNWESEHNWINRLADKGHPLTNYAVRKEGKDVGLLESAIELGQEIVGK